MSSPGTVQTDRLQLCAVADDDFDALHRLHSDPLVWAHLPSGRHTRPQQTRDLLAGIRADWTTHGIGYWTVRLRATDELVGVGGCALRASSYWNVYYRLSPAAWGQGLAGEVASAARAVARELRPELPVVVRTLAHNDASRRTAERCGFRLVWQGPDVGNPDPSAVRVVYADRPLPAEALALVTTAP